MNIILEPDSYKGSLTSIEAAATMKRAIQSISHKDNVISKPMADGGEGTVDALQSSSDGKQITLSCTGPSGEKIDTYYAIIDGNTAVIEIANIAGLVQVTEQERNPDTTTTYGLGEVISGALVRGCTSFIIRLGGSATNDGGLGVLRALGMGAWDENEGEIGTFGQDIRKVNRVSFDNLDRRLAGVAIKVACDVENPLYGNNGASAVYGPQKGATREQIVAYDKSFERFASIIERQHGKKYHDVAGAGAAGGLGFALLILGAKLVSGAELVAEAANLKQVIKQADLVLTGEGQSDEQTLYGKAPGYIANLANTYHVPAILISGSLTGDQDKLRSQFQGCFSIITRPMEIEECMEQAEELLFNQTKQVMHFIHAMQNK